MERNKQTQEGTGSAENTGGNRESQKNKLAQLTDNDKQKIAAEVGEDQSHIADLNDLGSLSGRDDYAGAPGDDMGNTNEETDR